MQERRRLERFDLHSPAKVQVVDEGGHEDVIDAVTKDISSAGAFLISATPVAEGLTVDVEVVLSFETLHRITGGRGKVIVRVKGKVVRSDETGMAVAFDRKFRMIAPEDFGAS
jgi:hypothetical protein